ncbi:serine hydrolase domain-containing protein [Nocardia bovistercoris]|uniref:Beta-lactamase family protein n=1 Tax=Nocardia bovistercoris TaxID=2785916 RepID=A0A931N4K8_9NOCA|nr:serine hydrolase domain-containing protein [Nocardia bovistercoris]MBH0781850.1 beta-lactamase family protein [Nocardia bovistercoris]
MSNVASSGDPVSLPSGVGGSAAAEFGPLVRAFARAYGRRKGAGAALAVHLHGEPLVDIWTGRHSGSKPWTEQTGSIVFSATKGITATVIHRLADRGLLDYDAPVAEYWPEFGANGKAAITVAEVMTHRAGLSGLAGLGGEITELLDHRLMEERLAAAAPDRLLGVPTYHAITYGWLLAGLARAITGRGMAELFRTEVSEPLGIDGIHLGTPPPDSGIDFAPLAGNQLRILAGPVGAYLIGRTFGFPGAPGAAARALLMPGMDAILEGHAPPILATELGAGNGVCTARGLAAMYGALANGGVVDGRRYLSGRTVAELRRIRSYRLDHALFYFPMLWHLGYHSMPMPYAHEGLGHIGLAGSFGWAEPRLGLSVGFVHNRMSVPQMSVDQMAAFWLLPLVMSCLRGTRRVAPEIVTKAAA